MGYGLILNLISLYLSPSPSLCGFMYIFSAFGRTCKLSTSGALATWPALSARIALSAPPGLTRVR